MASNYPPGVTGGEPQIAGWPDDELDDDAGEGYQQPGEPLLLPYRNCATCGGQGHYIQLRQDMTRELVTPCPTCKGTGRVEPAGDEDGVEVRDEPDRDDFRFGNPSLQGAGLADDDGLYTATEASAMLGRSHQARTFIRRAREAVALGDRRVHHVAGRWIAPLDFWRQVKTRQAGRPAGSKTRHADWTGAANE